METLNDKQIVVGEMVAVELIGMLEDVARGCEGEGRVWGQFELDREVLGEGIDWAPIFRNFKEVIEVSMRPQIVFAPDAPHAPHTPGDRR